ncbi:MAG: hypothetical protein JWR16_2896 [Nevskia sp.]|nr:hypothetical protein [Nevskia sp.]
MSELNLATLFDDSSEPSLLPRAELSSADDEQLRTARTTIRQRLRSELPHSLRDPARAAPVKTPRFFTQGSFSYKTIITPIRPPEQQADLDDGVYLPLGDIKAHRPSVASDKFIEATDDILRRLAAEEKWTFNDKNPCCSRLVIAENKHVDVPRYCMPDQQFELLVEKAAALEGMTLDSARADSDDRWELMPTSNVLLAHREDGWIKSDPRPISEWIETTANLRGSHFRKIIKILKSWRDFQTWANGGDPKSILLMALVHHAQWQQFDRRIDKTLLHVVKQIPALLARPVMNPAAFDGSADEPDLSKRLDEDGIRAEVSKRFAALARDLEDAQLKCGDPDTAIALLRNQFGARIPADPARIAEVTVEAAPAIAMRSQPPVRRTQAG